ncbi:MAG: microcin C ABC transporter permease YejB [Alphaproteobacteria bacterium]|nr:microcin C ABC transporter permease YejB [Alphaproteobacteria bacterium]
MIAYIAKRLALMIPTLFGMMALSFLIVQFAPGGPIERIAAQLQGHDTGATARFSNTQDAGQNTPQSTQSGGSAYRGAQGLDPEFIAELEVQFGFDKPAHERFFLLIKNYIRFDFGQSYYRDIAVSDLIIDKLPVSITLGLWTTLLTYLISIPLGIAKARRDGTSFDIWTSSVIIIGYAIPGFLFAVALIVFFAGGSYFDWFPLRGLVSEGWQELSLGGRILDYLWHITLPVLALAIGSFATTSLLTKNSFMEEMRKQYVMTARAKGAGETRVFYKHIFRNAMLIVVAGFPGAFIGAFFTGSLLIETIFSLDGLGLLSYESIVNRDYPVVFASLYIFGLIGLGITLISDLTYMWIDPRIDFSARTQG